MYFSQHLRVNWFADTVHQIDVNFCFQSYLFRQIGNVVYYRCSNSVYLILLLNTGVTENPLRKSGEKTWFSSWQEKLGRSWDLQECFVKQLAQLWSHRWCSLFIIRDEITRVMCEECMACVLHNFHTFLCYKNGLLLPFKMCEMSTPLACLGFNYVSNSERQEADFWQ